ncbi:MAG: glutamine amidotransferase [Phycisphaerae bacterium]|nr:glutamine amidotransferase [Phycisphaerae bacterium]
MTILAARLTVSASVWGWIALGVTVTALVILIWAYARVRSWDMALRLAFVLKLLACLLLALCLAEPLLHSTRAKPGANAFAIVADNSQGMTIRDPGAAGSRGEQMKTLLTPETAPWLAQLKDQFLVRQYTFDTRLQRLSEVGDLTWQGRASAMYTALDTLNQRYQGRPMAGVLLFTDGNPTDIPTVQAAPGVPVYPVLTGTAKQPRDLAVTNVSVTQTAFEDAPVTLMADVAASGYAGKTVTVTVTSTEGAMVSQDTWDVQASEAKQVFRFRLHPDQTGVLFYTVQVTESLKNDAVAPLTEATQANNQRTIMVDRGEGPYRILYVSGRPNWEFKFLRRALEEDPQVQLVGLIRVAKREPKYDWRGRTGEQTNPLYRGYDPDDPSLAEQYDQPVLVRLNTRDKDELSEGFPAKAEDLYPYHAILLDDVDASFFTQDQMELIRKFVAERGGGLMMLGGSESLERGAYDRTPIGALLPVYVDKTLDAAASGPVRMSLTREGWLEPWARLRDNEQAEKDRLADMPAFRVVNQIRRAKPGSRVVAAANEDAPAMVVQSYGRGRSGVLTVGDVWRWGLSRPDLTADRNKFWRQTLRWLVADVPERLDLTIEQAGDQPDQAVVLRVETRDKDFTPLDDVTVTLEVAQGQDEPVTLQAEPDLKERGVYRALFRPRTSGAYLARAMISHGTELLGTVETGWTVDFEAREFQSVQVNQTLLKELAQKTGGQVVQARDLDQFVKALPAKTAPITETLVRPLWDLPGVLPLLFGLVLVCFALEWTLRRWRGLP